MKLKAQMAMRVALAVVLLVAAGLLAMVIKDTLAQRNPESALPVIHVDYEGQGLPAKHVVMDSYEWYFIGKTIHWQEADRENWKEMEPAWVKGSVPLEVWFSFPADNVKVWREKDGSGHFEEVLGNLETPALPGVYTYRIEAEWQRGSVAYYVRVQVPNYIEGESA